MTVHSERRSASALVCGRCAIGRSARSRTATDLSAHPHNAHTIHQNASPASYSHSHAATTQIGCDHADYRNVLSMQGGPGRIYDARTTLHAPSNLAKGLIASLRSGEYTLYDTLHVNGFWQCAECATPIPAEARTAKGFGHYRIACA